MRTPTATVRVLLAGVAVLLSQGTGNSDTPVNKFTKYTGVAPEAWAAIDFEHLEAVATTADAGLTPTSVRKPASLPVPRLDWDSNAAGLPWATSAADDTGAASQKPATPADDAEPAGNSTAVDAGAPSSGMANFQIPPSAYKKEGIIPELSKDLQYQYGYGSESEIRYRGDRDLDERVRDNSLILTPEVNGYVTYRPFDWLETTLEMIFEREIAAHEEESIVLPSGEIEFKQKRRFSLLVDQAFVTIGSSADPVRLTVGRKNFEDLRHWLYDTSMDVALVTLKHGEFRTQAVLGREVLVDLDIFQREPRDKIDTYMLDTEYRGIEDVKIAAYGVYRTDNSGEEGQRWLMGVRSHGMPTDAFNYWTELAYLHGRDSQSLKIAAYAVDVGATYRLTEVPWMPNATLGYAVGSGDRNPNDWKNNNFRQTGLESNEVKFAGLTEFKGYGEVFDPELSNLRILTVGAGVRPAANISIDLVYHRYWLHGFTNELNTTALTAEVNQVGAILSKDVGSGLDLVVGIRSLFNIPRLALDVRAGLFFPQRAYLIDEVPYRDADTGSSVVVKFWW